jgi:hypothetical protein
VELDEARLELERRVWRREGTMANRVAKTQVNESGPPDIGSHFNEMRQKRGAGTGKTGFRFDFRHGHRDNRDCLLIEHMS